MPNLTIRIDVDTAAFRDSDGERDPFARAAEVKRIVRKYEVAFACLNPGNELPVYDSNGVRIGEARVSKR